MSRHRSTIPFGVSMIYLLGILGLIVITALAVLAYESTNSGNDRKPEVVVTSSHR